MSQHAAEAFPEFVLHRRGEVSIWIHRELANHAIVELIADADRFFEQPGCQIINDQRKIKVGRGQIRLNGETRTIYFKRYNAFSWRYKLTSLVTRSGGVKSLRGATILNDAGVSTAVALAAIDVRRLGMLSVSFFITEAIEEGKTADSYWLEDLLPLKQPEGQRRRRKFIKGLARLFQTLHAREVYHNDLKDANILVVVAPEGSESFFLLDLEGVRQYRRLSLARRIKNLVQLNRTLGRYVRQTEKLYFLKCYLGPGQLSRQEKRLWATRVVGLSKWTDRRKKLKRVLPGLKNEANYG